MILADKAENTMINRVMSKVKMVVTMETRAVKNQWSECGKFSEADAKNEALYRCAGHS